MDGKDRYRDNIFIERFWRSLKYEEVYLICYKCGAQARVMISKWITFYNVIRPHSSLAGKTPSIYYEEALEQVA